jgi:hypothetical protein
LRFAPAAFALGAAACAEPPLVLEVVADVDGFVVRADAPLDRVELYRGDELLTRERVPGGARLVRVPVVPEAGVGYRIAAAARALQAEQALIAPPQAPCAARWVVPGQPEQPVADGDRLEVGAGTTALRVVGPEASAATLRLAGADLAARDRTPLLAEHAGPAELRCPGATTRFEVRADALDPAGIGAQLSITAVELPVDRFGRPDASRPRGAIPTNAGLWERWLAWTGVGWRLRDPSTPWSWQRVALDWRGDRPLDVVITASVVPGDLTGPTKGAAPLPWSTADGRAASALVRLNPAATTDTPLPFWLDERALAAWVDTTPRTPVWRVIEVLLPGRADPVARWSAPLPLAPASSAALAGAAVGVALGAVGAVVLWRTARDLPRRRADDLALTALFASLSFVAGTVAQVIGLGFAAGLGPWGVLLTALVDDALQTAILFTLLTLRPHRGTAALATWIGWTLRAIVLGTLGPAELLILTSRVALLEGALWATGVTRGRLTPARLTAALVAVQLVATATGLAQAAVFYRLSWSPAYVAALLLLPGLIYPWLAARLAAPIAASLREVAP